MLEGDKSYFMNESKINYGNWVPDRLLILLWSLSGATFIVCILDLVIWKNLIVGIIFAILFLVCIVYSILMQQMHHAFSFTGGGLMGKVHEYLLEKLSFKGEGSLVDIGCGSGALAIRCAKKWPNAKIRGIDYWGIIWDYAKDMCENNAKLENINNVEFSKDDASHISFDDNTFDAAVSNFVFHEVRTVLDKRKLVREALRVVKKGGAFAFHDLFEAKNLYGDMNQFIEDLKKEGVQEIKYEPHTENLPFVPGYIKPMFKNMGIIYGIK